MSHSFTQQRFPCIQPVFCKFFFHFIAQAIAAIAEWPTQGKQSADYVLFAGLSPLAAVEAKRLNINVAGKIGQAERYARGFDLEAEHEPAWLAEGRGMSWPDGQGGAFQLPFAYSCNGRPLIKQSPEASGTWFRDVRQPSNLAKPLQGFHSPDGLLDHLRRSRAEAEARLRQEGFAYLGLRDYQQKAIAAVESALAVGQTNCLLAMATGTGKTRTIIGLIYRLLKAERFRRILFLVDRTALGDQALDVFNEAPLEQSQPLSKIYNVAELGDMAAEAETRVQVATVQAIRQAALGEALLPFDQRVARAMQKLFSQHAWTPLQRKWLDRLAKQLTHEGVIDHDFVNTAFANDGGAKQLDKLLSGQLEQVMNTLADGLWPQAAA